jgi:hypothetical protein
MNGQFLRILLVTIQIYIVSISKIYNCWFLPYKIELRFSRKRSIIMFFKPHSQKNNHLCDLNRHFYISFSHTPARQQPAPCIALASHPATTGQTRLLHLYHSSVASGYLHQLAESKTYAFSGKITEPFITVQDTLFGTNMPELKGGKDVQI